MHTTTSGQRVLVALSGGVDSSVAAALLKEQGYDVAGAFIVTWTAPWLPCTWKEERMDAMRAAAELGIPFHTVDLSKEYERHVVDYMVREYTRGRTPNPDIMCNKFVKFGAFFDWAKTQGYDYVATGHYARVSERQQLQTAVDTNKDQTYFLWTLTREHLARTRFPIGDYQKSDVRELAKKFGLHTATKKDSQGVCFLGQIDMKDFLAHYVPLTPGNVLNIQNEVIGTHEGALLYTLGERHGFTITKKTPNDAPMYVVEKDVEHNTLVVAQRMTEGGRYNSSLITLADTNWNTQNFSDGSSHHQLQARLRYRQSLFPIALRNLQAAQATVELTNPQQYVQPGQSLVVYNDDICVGGGVIDQSQ